MRFLSTAVTVAFALPSVVRAGIRSSNLEGQETPPLRSLHHEKTSRVKTGSRVGAPLAKDTRFRPDNDIHPRDDDGKDLHERTRPQVHTIPRANPSPRQGSWPEPEKLTSSGGSLDAALTLRYGLAYLGNGGNGEIQLTGRFYNYNFPGPTLIIDPGDTLNINHVNELSDNGSVYQHNTLSANDETNLHFHGLWVSGEPPDGDDAELVIPPGGSHQYSVETDATHMPGTHWYHPHRHGSTTLQLAGGAMGALIMKDPPNTLPPQVESARDVLFLAALHGDVTDTAKAVSGDSLLNLENAPEDEFMTVNGKYLPTLNVKANEWIRLRVLWTNFFEYNMNMQIDGCEMQLLAKDGIYIADYPRLITWAKVPSGGRADIMVRCKEPSTEYTIRALEYFDASATTWDPAKPIATIQTSAEQADSSDLVKKQGFPTYPEYLTDLREETVSPGCSCITRFMRQEDHSSPSGNNFYGVNGYSFGAEDNEWLHWSYFGAVVERTIYADEHPYHQHNFPFQLISGIGSGLNSIIDDKNYNKPGDWQDTVEGNGVIRFSPSHYDGKMILHCHHLLHEDRGMMAKEFVYDTIEGALGDDNETPCGCVADSEVALEAAYQP